jgi:hypothetical protein
MKREDEKRKMRRDDFEHHPKPPKFYDEKPYDHRHEDHKRPRPPRTHTRQTTTLFEDRQEMIAFVNEKGQEGHQIDIFKIEEGLYKVVVVQKKSRDLERL